MNFLMRRSGKVIISFCNGYRASTDHIFGHLPFAPAQGEVMRSIHRMPSIPVTDLGILMKYEKYARIGSSWKHKDIESGRLTPA